MEVSNSENPNDNSSSSNSSSRSPNRDFSSCWHRYTQGSRSTSRSLRHFDRSPELDYSQGRDYGYHSLDGNNNYRDRQYNTSYRRYNNSNGFSPSRNFSQYRYPNQNKNRPFQNHYQGDNYRNRLNNNNNNGYDSNKDLIVSKGSCSCLNQISGFEPENDTKSIISIIRRQNV